MTAVPPILKTPVGKTSPKGEYPSVMREGFAAVIRDGERAARGMTAFPDLSDEQLLSLTHYFRSVANALADKSD